MKGVFMFDMHLEPWIVGDISTIGLAEELAEQQVDDLVDYVRRNYGSCLRIDQLEDAMGLFDIDYFSLPKYLQDKIDIFNVD